MNSTTIDPHLEAHDVAVHQIDRPLPHQRAARRGARPSTRARSHAVSWDGSQAAGYYILLSEAEQELLRIFQRRPGQFLSLATLERLVREEHTSKRAQAAQDLLPLLDSLSQKLQHLAGVGRLFEVTGCGYILWTR